LILIKLLANRLTKLWKEIFDPNGSNISQVNRYKHKYKKLLISNRIKAFFYFFNSFKIWF